MENQKLITFVDSKSNSTSKLEKVDTIGEERTLSD